MSEWAEAVNALQKLTQAAAYPGVQLTYREAKGHADTVRRLAHALNAGPEKKPRRKKARATTPASEPNPSAGEQRDHATGCSARGFTYEVGSGEPIPECVCSETPAPLPAEEPPTDKAEIIAWFESAVVVIEGLRRESPPMPATRAWVLARDDYAAAKAALRAALSSQPRDDSHE